MSAEPKNLTPKKKPRDWFGFWVRFSCAVLFFGLLFAFILMRYVEDTGLSLGITIWIISTVSAGIYVARVGDDAWNKMIDTLRWW